MNLLYAMREVAHLFAGDNRDSVIEVFTRYRDGLDIPPSTHIEVIVRLVHDDRQVTPELEMELETA